MAFKGDLTNISLFDVFQTLNQNRQSGVLVLSREGETKKIHISPQGVRIFFTRSFRPLKLGEIFVRRGRITPQDVEILLLEQKKEYRPFGQLLVESGKVAQEDVERVLRYHAEDEIFEIFAWEAGSFSFYDGQEAGDSATPLSEVLMDPAGLCLEAARRMDEIERLREIIPSNDEFFLRLEDRPRPEELDGDARALAANLEIPHSIEDLRDLVGLSLYDCLRGVFALAQAGVIRVLTGDELIAGARSECDSGRIERAAQLLELAHRRQPSNRELLEECIATIERLGQPRRLAKHLATLGRMCLEDGEIEGSIEHLEQTLRYDPSHFDSLVALREAFIAQGDEERVAEISLKIARQQAEYGDLEGAIEACCVGMEKAPHSMGLRFYYAQLLARVDRVDEARTEILAIVQDTEDTRDVARSRKAQELLASCFKLLLKIDSSDADAQQGLYDLERARTSAQRRRQMFVRLGVAAALLLVVGVVGLTVGGRGPGDLLEDIEAARDRGNHTRALELVAELVTKHPDSEEAHQALAIRGELDKRHAQAQSEQREKERKVRGELGAEFADLRDALMNRPYLEAASAIEPFLTRMSGPDVAFLRKDMGVQVEYELIGFLERISNKFAEDRQQVAVAARNVEEGRPAAKRLAELEMKLSMIRQRDWPALAPELFRKLKPVAESRFVGKAKQAIEELQQRLQGAGTAFGTLDTLYFTVRRERLKLEIESAVATAKREGLDMLRDCELSRARELFDTAYRKADAVASEEPREHFQPLLVWVHRRRILDTMRHERDKIDSVIETLKDVERLREEGRHDTAYRLLRDLVSHHVLIQFEKKYRFPYRIASTPSGAEVHLDGRLVGKTPCAIELEIAQKQTFVELRRPGFEPWEAKLVPTNSGLNGTLDASLNKEVAWDVELAGSLEAPPIIAQGKLLLATNRATLLAIDLETGDHAWEADPDQLDRITASPVVAGDNAWFVTVSGKTYRVRLKDGEIRASLDVGGQVLHDPAYADGTLYVATRRPRLVAIRDEEVAYTVPLASNPSTQVVHLDGRVFVGTAEGTVLVREAQTGDALFAFRTPSASSFFGGLVAHGSLVLGGAEDGKLYAFAAGSRLPAWSYATRGPITSRPVSDGAQIFLPSREGYLYALDEKGDVARKYDLGNAIESHPAVAGGFLYALGGNRVQAFDVESGRAWWNRAFKDQFPQHVVAGDGYIVVITNKPWIYAFPKDVR